MTVKHYHDEMPLYVAGQLGMAEKDALEQHTMDCPACRAELDFWRELSGEIQSANAEAQFPVGAAEEALKRIRAGMNDKTYRPGKKLKTALLAAYSLLRAQAYLVRRELWPASAGVMALGVILALVSKHAEAISFLVPLVAAASLAILYDPEHDAAYELALSTLTSPWKILLARLSVVSVFNLLLALLASLTMLLIVPPEMLGIIILGWLAPMAFLSSLALLASMWIRSGSAVVLTYGLWLLHFHQVLDLLGSRGTITVWDHFLTGYARFWRSPDLLLLFSGLLLLLALASTRFAGRNLPQIAL